MIKRGKSLLLMLAAVVIYFVLHANVHAAAQDIAKDRKVEVKGYARDGSDEITLKVEAQDTEEVCDRVYCHVPVDAQSNWVKEIEMQVGRNVITAIGDSGLDVHTNTLKGLANNLVFIGNATGNYSNDDPNDPASASCTIHVDYPGGTIIESESVELAGSGVATVGVKGKLIGNQIVAGLYYVYVYGGFGAGSKGTAKLSSLSANASLDGSNIAGGSHGVSPNHKAPWHAFTVMIHKDDKTGGYRVVDYDSGCSTRRLRDMVNKQGYKVVQGGRRGVQPFSEGYEYEVMDFHGNGKDDPIYLCVGESAQFEAIGVIEPSAGCRESNIGILNQFKVESVAGETMPEYYMDGTTTNEGLGVFTGLSPGHAVVRSCYTNSGPVLLEKKIDVYVVKANLVPDWNHDRVIDSEDEKKVADCKPFRFWINDDDDNGDVAEGNSDVPGQGGGILGMFDRANYEDGKVNGRCDLEDFFPVWLDLYDALNILQNEPVQYKLKHADSAVRIVYTDLTKGEAGKFLTTECNLHEANTFEVTSSGIVLDAGFLNNIKSDANKGVLMVEGTKVKTSPLILEIWKGSEKICSGEMPLSVSSVTDMYRTVNLRNMQSPGTLPEPPNYPDSLTSGTNLVFLHGYQPGTDANWPTAWLAEMFKRFYWSGSQAKFHGVSWLSSGSATAYQPAVTNAFRTAPALKDYVAGLNGDVIITAHSLGNMAVSSAIVDQNMSVSKYMLCDAAVASEAYDQTMDHDDRLINTEWTNYDSRTWAANWHERFQGTGDSRENLAWPDRFGDVANHGAEVWNFYSTGDEVFDLTTAPSLITGVFYVHWWFIIPTGYNWNPGRYSWQKQELFKGTAYAAGLVTAGCTYDAGWGFNSTIVGPNPDGQYEVQPVYSTTQAAAATDETLRANPVFTNHPSWLVGNNALSQYQINYMLGMGIPALTPSTGLTQIGNPISSANQFNLNNTDPSKTIFQANYASWPNRGDPDFRNWLHNDMKDVAYFFNYPLFDVFVLKGGLK